jgi:hypothetical protein
MPRRPRTLAAVFIMATAVAQADDLNDCGMKKPCKNERPNQA